jgi:cysteine desulfurase family protein (TIGR01976 family)
MGADLTDVRELFPALAQTHQRQPVVFADGPGGSQVPGTVIDAMAAYLRTSNANAHGAFATSVQTDALIDRAHRAAADLLGCQPDEVVFGPNATTLLFAMSRSFGRTLRAGDEVVVTRLDHDANVRPWVLVAEDAGATVRWVDVRDEDVTLDLSTFQAALSDRTRLVAFSLASKAVGTVTPAPELARLAHQVGAVVVCDGVHVAQHRSIDVAAIGADIVVCSPYKIFGPHLGILFGRRALLESWFPYKVRPASDDLPDRWETGTQNHEGYAGFAAAVDYLADVGRIYGTHRGSDRRAQLVAAFAAIGKHEADLSRRFLEGLHATTAVRLYGIADPRRVGERTPTFAVRVGDQHPSETAKLLAERGIFVWDGDYYAIELMERLGLEESGGAVRVGFCHYNTIDEVDRVVDELRSLA